MLINCVAYQNGQKLSDISIEAISEYLDQPDCFVWVALRDATHEELVKMQEEFDLHPLAVEDAHHGHQRPKIDEYGESVFAVLHMIEVVNGQLVVGEVGVFAGSNYVLSVRNRSQRNFLGVRDRCEREPELLAHGAGFVLYALMDSVVDSYFPIIDSLEDELEAIEERIFAPGSARKNIEQLYELKRKVMILRHAVTPLMEASGKLLGGRVPAVCANSHDYFRDVYDHLVRINGSIESVRETISTAIHVNLSMVTIEESEVSKKLAAWAGIFGLATVFVGIWGMNFQHMPELQWELGYPFALLTMTLGCYGLYFRFKRAGWL
jgi:magnesium transporter